MHCGHTICGGRVPSDAIKRDIRAGRVYDPAAGVPAGIVSIVVSHPRWGYAYQAIGFEPCQGVGVNGKSQKD